MSECVVKRDARVCSCCPSVKTCDPVHLDPHRRSYIIIIIIHYHILCAKTNGKPLNGPLDVCGKKLESDEEKKITEIFLVTITYYPTCTLCGARGVIILLLSPP